MSPSVLLGVTGGIAAYKIPSLVRLLVEAKMDVHIIMTEAATHFVTPLTLATLSGNPVWEDMWSRARQPSVEHISLADRADIAVMAPATANTIGKIASGIADNMLTTVFLALKCPVLLCPSMNVNMYRHPIVQANLNRLRELGYHVMEPESGFLACGWTGEGRMPDPESIFQEIMGLAVAKDLQGRRILVTAGPTEEPLDPVRFLTNRSSGKMGVAIARRAAARGASVTLVAGPLKVPPPPLVRHIPVRTAREMYDRVMEAFPETDIVIKAAAVADFRPAFMEGLKTAKEDVGLSLRLLENPDILMELGRKKGDHQILVGFAAETHDALQHARAKLAKKNLDLLVLNDVTEAGAGFDCDTNIVHILYRTGGEEQLEMMSKDSVADLILDRVRDLGLQMEIRTE
jgi:phosphopantothenoylcysteine decarboxylase / phosphopantothenate---cysteine ligase